jgi:hypothetical protein
MSEPFITILFINQNHLKSFKNKGWGHGLSGRVLA